MPRLTWLNHAGFVLEYGDVRLATDPWSVGDAFLHGWRLVCERPFPADELARVTHLWFSHEHADHFSPATLRSIPAEVRRKIRVLYQLTKDGSLRDYCRDLGFAEVVELRHLEWQSLGDGFRVKCGHWYGRDSWLLVEVGGKRFLNLNDCIVEHAVDLHDLEREIGEIDVLLAQFAVGSWLGNPEETEWRTKEAADALRALGRKCRALAPRQVIPAASFFYFSHPENFYLNEAIAAPARALEAVETARSEPVLLYPGDRWELGEAWPRNAENAARYARDLAERMAAGPIAPANDAHAKIDRETLRAEADAYFDRVRGRNPAWKLVQQTPVVLGFLDEPKLRLRLSRDGLAPVRDDVEPDVRLAKESLLFCFRDVRGANTLLVNGRFRARDRRSKDAFFKFFAVAAANRRGFTLTVAYLVAFRLKLWRRLLRTRLFALAPWAFR